MDNSNISVVIPTRNRPELLAEAIRSVLAQTLCPAEIMVGDDSDDPAENGSMISQLRGNNNTIIQHLTDPTGGQGANVERLFQSATQRWLCLLHDDDLLMPNALEVLLRAAKNYRDQHAKDPVLVYGQQIIIDKDGRENAEASKNLNKSYYRTSSQRADLAENSMLAAVVQQSPNDGYLVDRSAAVVTKYNSDLSVGLACDFAFAFRLSKTGSFCYVPTVVAKYRISEDSVTRGFGKTGDDTGIGMYFLLKRELSGKFLAEPLVKRVLREAVKTAIDQLRRHGQIRTAWRVFLSPEHLVSWLTPRFWLRGFRLMLKSLRMW